MSDFAPTKLGEGGHALWLAVTTAYALRPDELRTLEDACAATDLIETLTEAWEADGRPMMSKGSMGQLVEHPLIGSIDKQRKARNAMFRQLALPDTGEGPASWSAQNSVRARNAALARRDRPWAAQ